MFRTDDQAPGFRTNIFSFKCYSTIQLLTVPTLHSKAQTHQNLYDFCPFLFSFSTQHLSCTKDDPRSSRGCVAQTIVSMKPSWMRHEIFWGVCWHTSPNPSSAQPLLLQMVHTAMRASGSDQRVGLPPKQGSHTKTCIFKGISRTPH